MGQKSLGRAVSALFKLLVLLRDSTQQQKKKHEWHEWFTLQGIGMYHVFTRNITPSSQQHFFFVWSFIFTLPFSSFEELVIFSHLYFILISAVYFSLSYEYNYEYNEYNFL